MNIDDAFPSKWLKAKDLDGRTVSVVINDVLEEDIGDGTKPVLYFIGKEKGVVLNKTNASMISESYGKDTDAWHGQPLEVYPDRTQFKGEIVDCIRVRIPAPPAEPGEDGQPAEVPF